MLFPPARQLNYRRRDGLGWDRRIEPVDTCTSRDRAIPSINAGSLPTDIEDVDLICMRHVSKAVAMCSAEATSEELP